MTLKDWKSHKFKSNGKIGIEWKKEREKSWVRIEYMQKCYRIKTNKNYSINILTDKIFDSKTFKTKSQALKYAKAYMKKH